MWINKNISEKVKNSEKAVCGQVTASKRSTVNVQGDRQCINLPVVAPCGIAYVPCAGDNTVVLPLNGSKVCIGNIMPAKELSAGEIMLYSAGGATLVLKNDGQILANGKNIAGD